MKNEIQGCNVIGRLGGKFEHTLDLTRRVYDVNAVAPTITTCGGGNTEPKIMEEYTLSDQMKKYINSYDDRYIVNDNALTINKEIAPAITTREGCARADSCSYMSDELPQNYNIANKDITPYRIRKLTERECGRLMGVKDDDIAKIGKNLSRSAMMHCFGDSIVTSCLMAIFGQLFNVRYEDKIKKLAEELTNAESIQGNDRQDDGEITVRT